MASTINASNTTGGVITTADGSGILQLQSGGTTALTINGANVTVAGTFSATGGVNVSTASGVLPVANGGTNSSATPTAGGVGYGTGTAHAYTAAGSSGGVLYSTGATAPAFSAAGSAGGVFYSTGSTAPAFTAAGTSGQVLTSSGSGAPTWANITNPPGAFGQFSVVGPNTSSLQFYAASPADMLNPGGFAANPVPSYATSAGSYISPTSIFYSTYYSCWFCLGVDPLNTSSQGLYSSKNGLNWTCVFTNFRGKAGAAATANMIRAAIDDSNGALFISTADYTNLQVIVYATSGTNWGSFTPALSVNFTGGVGDTPDLLYINTGSVSTSAIVVIFNIDNVISLRTCPPGTRTFTTQLASGVANGTIQYNRASGFAFVAGTGTASVTYFTNNNAQTGWANNTSPGVTFSGQTAAISNGVMVALTNGIDTIAYSTTGSGAWTSIPSYTGGYTTYALIHNGSAWISLTSYGLLYNTNTLPTGTWTLSPASGAIGMNSARMRQRYI